MARSDNLTGALLMMGSMAAFTFNDAMIKGLSGAAERNGTQGRVESYDDARGRYMVRVEVRGIHVT